MVCARALLFPRRCCCVLHLQDACAQFNCGTNPKSTPAPQLEQGAATEDLCCVVPAVQRPLVQVDVSATVCNDADNERMAAEFLRQLTQGLSSADAQWISVTVGACNSASVSNPRR